MPATTPTSKNAASAQSGKPMNAWMIVSAVLAIALVISIVASAKGSDTSFKKVSETEAGNTLIAFVNEIYAGQIGQSTLKSVTKKHGLYEVIVTVDNAGQQVDQTVFVSQDGLLFVPQALEIEDVRAQYKAFQQSGGQAVPPTDPNTQTVPAEGELMLDQEPITETPGAAE